MNADKIKTLIRWLDSQKKMIDVMLAYINEAPPPRNPMAAVGYLAGSGGEPKPAPGVGTSLKDGEFFKRKPSIAPPPPNKELSRAERQERVWFKLEYDTIPKNTHHLLYAWASENLSANYRLGTVTDQAPLKRALKDNLRAITSEQLGELELILGV